MDQKHSASAHQAEARSTARIYTKPELHERLKDEILASDRGGQAGEWSPRKAQLLTHEYRQAGGGYTFAKRSHSSLQFSDGPDSGQRDTGLRPPQQVWTDFATPPRPAPGDQQRGPTRPDQPSAPGAETNLRNSPQADEA